MLTIKQITDAAKIAAADIADELNQVARNIQTGSAKQLIKSKVP